MQTDAYLSNRAPKAWHTIYRLMKPSQKYDSGLAPVSFFFDSAQRVSALEPNRWQHLGVGPAVSIPG